jgi:hypothetical protein
MTCEKAWQQYIDADKEAAVAEKRLQDFSARFIGMPPGMPTIVGDEDFGRWEKLGEEAARTRQLSLEKLRGWRRRAASHRGSPDRRRRGDKAVSVGDARREFTDARKEWVAAQRRLVDFERQMKPTDPAPAEAPPVGSRRWETWNRLHEEETAARERAMEKQKVYAAAKARR